MKKGFIISALAIFAVALFLRFALVGYSFLAYCLMCAAAVVLIYGFLIWKKLKALIIILTILLILGFALFLVMEIPVIIDSFGDKDVDADYIIVLGAGVRGSVPSLSMINRMTPTIEYMESHPDCIAILTGGQGEDEDLSEALAMYNYLTERGIDPQRLIMEDKATSTEENLKFSFDIIGDELAEATIGVVSSEYHLHRAKTMAKMLGVEVYGIPGRTSYPVLMINYFIREAFGMVHLKVYGI
ncbi:MAG: YdcF family protein [Oscillospiraceae bacterium]|nr:YdcF family protein [Oscillospiraceae bacterium]